MGNRRVNLIRQYLWAGLLLFLPITSMPLMVKLVHSNSVAAPSGLILALFVLVWFLPYLMKGGGLPKSSVPLLLFTAIAVVSALLSCFYFIPLYKDHSVLSEISIGLITLLIGLLFYFCTVTWVRNENTLLVTLRWVTVAGCVVIIWCAVQATAWYSQNRYPQWLRFIHDLYSIGPLVRQRVSGFALEPSWLAHQLNVLFIPYWLGASITGFTCFRRKLWKLSVENFCLVFGAGILFLTYSRIGLAAFLMMLFIIAAHWISKPLLGLTNWVISCLRLNHAPPVIKKMVQIGCLIFFMAIGVGVLLGLAWLLSKLDYRMRHLLNFDLNHHDALLYYAEKLSMAARFVYWDAGLAVFDKFPWLGAGLGNSGFYFPQYLHPYAWKLVEVRELVYHTQILMNTKSIWVRILAETGIVGFCFFFAWLLVTVRGALAYLRSSSVLLKALGWFGCFTLVGLFFDGFSLDSFAMPYFWISFGMISSVGVNHLYFSEKRGELFEEEKHPDGNKTVNRILE